MIKVKKLTAILLCIIMGITLLSFLGCFSGCDVHISETNYELLQQIELLQQQIADLQEQLNARDKQIQELLDEIARLEAELYALKNPQTPTRGYSGCGNFSLRIYAEEHTVSYGEIFRLSIELKNLSEWDVELRCTHSPFTPTITNSDWSPNLSSGGYYYCAGTILERDSILLQKTNCYSNFRAMYFGESIAFLPLGTHRLIILVSFIANINNDSYYWDWSVISFWSNAIVLTVV